MSKFKKIYIYFYLVEHVTNKRSRYVGITTNPATRFGNRYQYNAEYKLTIIKKEKFTCQVKEVIINRWFLKKRAKKTKIRYKLPKEVYAMESKYIIKYNTFWPNGSNVHCKGIKRIRRNRDWTLVVPHQGV